VVPESPEALLAHDLLAWFDRRRRDLPWRRSRDPYRVWLSEVMLQQTRVETVLPYFERFLARFPTVERLAAAPLEDVLAAWSGLGYYRRARQLHATARLVAAAGELPRTLDGLLRLPGIGPYTAAAVASIAFGVVVPVLDGNVERVMARRLAIDTDPKTRAARARLLDAAAALLVASRPGDSNQALMELGATICLPRRPLCHLCPLLSGCEAARGGEPERYPPPRRRRRSERRQLLVAVVAMSGRVLLYRRPPTSRLLAGTWELPWLELAAGGQESRETLLADKYGGDWQLGAVVAAVRHGITYRDLQVTICRAAWRPGGGGAAAGLATADEVREGAMSGWFDERQRALLPTSSLVGKVLRACARAEAAAHAG
jgi:A/G-specific adenine glycosylase